MRNGASCRVQLMSLLLLLRVSGDSDAEDEEDDATDLPPYAMRVSIAKLMIEVGEPAAAAHVLDRLLFEDDSVPEVWFLIAAAYRDSRRPATARQYLETFCEVRAWCVRT
jgi:predicted Zn-dependent protease